MHLMTKLMIILMVTVAVTLVVTDASAWWDTDWDYRQEITITNPPAVSGFQAPFTITYDAHMDADFDDIRFVDGDDTTELDYWIESYVASTSATGYVELADTGDTIYVYYGNDEATTTSDGDATFHLFDHFDGTALNSSKWEVLQNNGISVSDGALHISSGATNYGALASLAQIQSDILIQFRIQTRTYATSLGVGNTDLSGVGSSIGLVYYTNYESAIYTGPIYGGNRWAPPRTWTTSSSDGDVITAPPAGYFVEEFAIPEGGYLKQRRNGGAWTTSTRYTGVSGSHPIHIIHYRGHAGMDLDYILVRKYAATEPSFAYGEEEESPFMLHPFPGCSNKPTDPDADTLYEDINGNSRWDFNDLVIFATNLAWAEANEPVANFDWNTNTRCDFDDVYELWLTGGMI